MRSALEWAEAKAMAADGVTKSEIARRLGINRRTAAKLVEAVEPLRYSRAPAGSMLDPLEPVLRKLIKDWEDIKAPRVTDILRDDYGYAGSVDLVRKRLALLRPRSERAAQRTGYRPGQVLQVEGRDADPAADRRTRAPGLRADLFVAVLGAGRRTSRST